MAKFSSCWGCWTSIATYTAICTCRWKPILSAIDEAGARVLADLEGKLSKEKLRNEFLTLFDELREKAKNCNNVAILQNIKLEAGTLKIRYQKAPRG